MASTKPCILGIGLTLTPGTDVFHIEAEKAASQGFELATYEADVKALSEDEILKRLSEKLKEREYAAVTIGFGVRGKKELTGLFEKMVNLCIVEGKGAKLGFAITPNDIVDAAGRVLGGNPGTSSL